MTLDISKERAALEQMKPKQLREKYAEVFEEPSRSGNKAYLIKRILWGLQAREEGDISERARRRAAELARLCDIRRTAPKASASIAYASPQTVTRPVRFTTDARLPSPGTVLARAYKGKTVEVMVLPDGFEHQGQRYRSLSAVAKAITGSHCNGFTFFGLSGSKPQQRAAS